MKLVFHYLKTKCEHRCKKKRKYYTLLFGVKTGKIILEITWQFYQKARNEITCYPAVPHLGIHPTEFISTIMTLANPCSLMIYVQHLGYKNSLDPYNS